MKRVKRKKEGNSPPLVKAVKPDNWIMFRCVLFSFLISPFILLSDDIQSPQDLFFFILMIFTYPNMAFILFMISLGFFFFPVFMILSTAIVLEFVTIASKHMSQSTYTAVLAVLVFVVTIVFGLSVFGIACCEIVTLLVFLAPYPDNKQNEMNPAE